MVYPFCLYSYSLSLNPNHQGNHTRRGSHRVELMSDCKRASLSQIINLFIPAKYVELGDKAIEINILLLASEIFVFLCESLIHRSLTFMLLNTNDIDLIRTYYVAGY